MGRKERGGEERQKRRGESRSSAPGAGRAAAAGRALGRLLRRPLREGRAISELGALRCQPGHHLTLGRLAPDTAPAARALPAVGGERRGRGNGARRQRPRRRGA